MNYIPNHKYKILSPQGMSNFQGIRKITKNQYLIITTNKNKLISSLTHKFIIEGKQILAKNLSEGMFLTKQQKIINIEYVKDKIQLYDIVQVEKNNLFLIEDGIISHNCQFATSGDTVISNEILEKLDKQSIMDPLQKMHRDELWIWRFAQNKENYILSADVARGDGSDFSAFQILSIQKNEQVAEYKGKISTVEFGQLIVRIAKMYNNALVVVENASIGWAVLQEIINQGYKNLYYHKKDYKYIDPELHSKIRQSKNFDRQKDIVGFTTSSRTRPLIIERMITIIQNNEFIIHSKRLLNQFWTFIWLNGKQQAMRGYNDDLVMALAIGIWVRNTAYIINKEARAFAKTRLASINSGLNLKYKEESQISSGFFNSNNAFEQLQQNKIEIGSQLIDLNEFYFSKGKEDK